MAEAFLNKKASEKFEAFSAGSEPTESVHPLSIDAMHKFDIDISEFKTKQIDQFKNEEFDFVITLCDKAKETCPCFPGKPVFAHWGFQDPVDFEGTEEEKREFFYKIPRHVETRINIFISLPMERQDKMALEQQVRNIANI